MPMREAFHNRSRVAPAPALALALALFLVLGVSACMDRSSPVSPELEAELPESPGSLHDPGEVALALTCAVSPAEATLTCGPRDAEEGSEDGASRSPGILIMGGQDEFVRLNSTGTQLNEGDPNVNVFWAFVTVQNLIGQAIGTADGETLDPEGIRVFYSTYPYITEGTGSLDVWPLSIPTATFTAPGQRYIQYDALLAPGEVSGGIWWGWIFSKSVTAFEFEVLVSAQVPRRGGWMAFEEEVLSVMPGEPVPLPLERYDALGRPRSPGSVEWTSSAPGILSVDANGAATSLSPGFATVTATSGSLSAELRVRSDEVVPTISGASTSLLEPGEEVTLLGTGFNGEWDGGAWVRIGGVEAEILGVTSEAMQIRVPQGVCAPQGPVQVVVSNGFDEGTTELDFVGAPAFSLAVGEQLVLDSPTEFCLSFLESGASEDYMIGIQRVSETFDAFTAVEVRSMLAPGADPAAGLPSMWAGVAPAAAPHLPSTQELELERAYQEHLRKKEELRAAHEAILASLGPVAAAPARAPAPTSHLLPSVGDTVTEYSVTTGNMCTNPAILQVEVRAVTPNAIFLEDIDNPARISDAAIAQWMDFFENESYPALLASFGPPSDTDGNGRVKFLSTKELNKLGPLGYVTTADWVDRSSCGASSEGEIFYMQGLDPDRVYSQVARTEASLSAQIDRVLAHEFVHVIQFGRRIEAGEPPQGGRFLTAWEAEGQATFAEMVVGLATEGRSFGQDYGYPVASTYWYGKTFFDHRYLFGWGGTSAPRIDHAPEICNWMAYQRCNEAGSPWLNYAVPSLLIQYLSDHHGVAQVNQGMIDGTFRGFENLANVTGLTEGEILARWWATLAVDGRVPGAAPELTVPSWDLHHFWSSLSENERLQPRERTFADYLDEVSIHSASTAFFRVSGEGRGATAISFRAPGGGFLSSEAQVWVVRLQ